MRRLPYLNLMLRRADGPAGVVLGRGEREEWRDAAEWAEARLGWTPDAVQAEILRSPAQRLLLNCSRQWGKTTVCAAKALHFALERAGSVTLVAAPTQRQSTLFVAKVLGYLRRLEMAARPAPGMEGSVMLANGARIYSLPGRADSVRGFSADLLIVDEAARISTALFEALMPTLASTNGPLWLLSTPNGLGDLFHRFWHDEGTEWTRFRIPATECGRFNEEFLAGQRLLLGETAYRQEYLCEFMQDPEAFFPLELLEAAMEPVPAPMVGRRRLL